MSKLYIVGTPLGNLGDISTRAIETLNMVDFIAAEDTRVTIKLLNHFEIKKPMISYYEHNIQQRGQYIANRILAGESCAIVTDAGMPCISDPGEDLVRLCTEAGIEVLAVPGPSAAITALALSGLSTSRFAFEGFLSVKKNSRFSHLEQVKNDSRTLLFYEAPHKLMATLKDMYLYFGDRRIAIARELTKYYEQVLRFTLSEAIDYYENCAPKGEFVLVIEGAAPQQQQPPTMEQAVEMVLKLKQEGISLVVATKTVAKDTGYKKAEIYKQVCQVLKRD